jgi:hypothetical protein
MSFSIHPSARPNDFLDREPLLKAQQPFTSEPKGYECRENIQFARQLKLSTPWLAPSPQFIE